MKHIASVSFGKDSLAMLLMLIEKKMPLDEVVFYDTGMEFKAIYHVRDQIKPLLREQGIKYTELCPARPFSYDMFDRPKTKRTGERVLGDGWCGGPCRWGTFQKQRTLNQHTGAAIVYLGIAADEPRRLEKLEPHKRAPLADWGMTEKDCLQYCYDKGFYWEENGVRLYDVLDRVSCWCCANKNLKELRNMYQYLPDYWQRLREMQSRLERPMKGPGKSVFELEERFKRELEQDAV